MRTLYLYLDDLRNPEDMFPWTVVRSARTAFYIVKGILNQFPDCEIVMSLDHDLGEDLPTGYDFLYWIERGLNYGEFNNPVPNLSIYAHSANPVGLARMEQAATAIDKLLEKRRRKDDE